MSNPEAKMREVDDDDDPGYFFMCSHMARKDPDIWRYVTESPAPEIAARLMRLDRVRFFYDQIFIKDPGTLAPTPWHNDLPFWNFAGNHIASVAGLLFVNDSGIQIGVNAHLFAGHRI